MLSQSLILTRKPTRIQCGRLQFFPWSCTRINGEVKGIVENIKDVQKHINYWEMLMIHKIQTEGGGGSQFVDPEGFESPAEMQKYINERGNPKSVFKTKKGYLRNRQAGPAVPTSKSGFPAEVTQHLDHMINTLLPKISKVTPAGQGMSESANESGYLYRQKKLQTDIQQFRIYESLRIWWNEIGEAYLYQIGRTYGNGVQRGFYDRKTKGMKWINKRDVVNGQEVLLDNMSELRNMRHTVSVTESEDAPTKKVETMMVATELMKEMPQSKVLTINMLASKITQAVDVFSAQDKEQLKHFDDIELQAAEEQLLAQTANMRAVRLQQERNIAALQPPQGAPGGTAPTGTMGQPGQAASAPAGAGGRPPNLSINFKDLPPIGQVQAAQQAGISLPAPSAATSPTLQQSGGGDGPCVILRITVGHEPAISTIGNRLTRASAKHRSVYERITSPSKGRARSRR